MENLEHLLAEENYRDQERPDHDSIDNFLSLKFRYVTGTYNRLLWNIWSIHFVIILIELAFAAFVLATWTKQSLIATTPGTCSPLLDHELQMASGILSYEEVTFAASGFHEHDEIRTVFESDKSPEVDLAWLNLTSGKDSSFCRTSRYLY